MTKKAKEAEDQADQEAEEINAFPFTKGFYPSLSQRPCRDFVCGGFVCIVIVNVVIHPNLMALPLLMQKGFSFPLPPVCLFVHSYFVDHIFASESNSRDTPFM
jgi:hypothetical protein